MVILALSIVLFLALLYILLMPIVLHVDTSRGHYYIQLKGLAKASVKGHKDQLLQLDLNIFFMSFTFYPLRKGGTSKKKKEVAQVKQKKPKRRISMQTGMRVLKSFTVKQFYIDIDTGDCITNAKLYPVFAFLNYYKGGCHINFEGRNSVLLSMENRPIRIIKSFINI